MDGQNQYNAEGHGMQVGRGPREAAPTHMIYSHIHTYEGWGEFLGPPEVFILSTSHAPCIVVAPIYTAPLPYFHSSLGPAFLCLIQSLLLIGPRLLLFALQDAEKGVLFDRLPPVLQLQLKRFEYDIHRDTMVKVCGCVWLCLCVCVCVCVCCPALCP